MQREFGAAMRRVLFMSGSLGTGHVTRDLSIVNGLRAMRRDVDIAWLVDDPETDHPRSRAESRART